MAIEVCVVDTNVLLRIPKRSDPNHQAVDRTLSQLAIQGTSLYYIHQTSRALGHNDPSAVAKPGTAGGRRGRILGVERARRPTGHRCS